MPAAGINGVQLHYEIVGDGEPLLLIMGYGMPGDAWGMSQRLLNL